MDRDAVAERFDCSLMFMDPAEDFDKCVIGVAERLGFGPVVVYDEAKVIASLVGQGMDEEEAREFFDYNIAGSYVGESGPWFMTPIDKLQ